MQIRTALEVPRQLLLQVSVSATDERRIGGRRAGEATRLEAQLVVPAEAAAGLEIERARVAATISDRAYQQLAALRVVEGKAQSRHRIVLEWRGGAGAALRGERFLAHARRRGRG